MAWQWRGRDDGPQPEARRWHQAIHPWDAEPAERQRLRPLVVIGYPSDAGVRANQGRPGAAEGPSALRTACSNLPAPSAFSLFDAGDVSGPKDDVLAWQRSLAAAVAAVRVGGGMPIVLGGGHDQAFGHWLGVVETASKGAIVGCIKIDAHVDMRPLTRGHPHSGSPFMQVHSHSALIGAPFRYLLLGMQPAHNTPALLQSAAAHGAQIVDADAFTPSQESSMAAIINRFIASVDLLCLSIDLDAFLASSAPGVSAPSPMGILPDAMLRTVLRRIAGSGKVAGIELAECSPPLDIGGRTARLGAALLDCVVRALPVLP